MKKLLGAMFGAVLILGACSGDDKPVALEAETPVEAEQTETSSNAEPVTAPSPADQGAEHYKVCAACHGADLQGGKGGAGYDKPITGLSKDQVLTAIQEGPGIMPKDMVKGEDAENLAEWISKQ